MVWGLSPTKKRFTWFVEFTVEVRQLRVTGCGFRVKKEEERNIKLILLDF
jgi:hypothetical protein